MSTMTTLPGIEDDPLGGWCGDATSVVEFLRPLREQLDAPGVLEVCVNRPGEL
jgi:type IV secretion system protein VirB11